MAAARTDLWAENSQLCTLPLATPLLKASVTSQNKPCFLCSFCRRDSSEQWEEEVKSSASSASPSPTSALGVLVPLLLLLLAESSGLGAAAAIVLPALEVSSGEE